MQKVSLGRTKSGIRGLFTGGYLACSLKETDDPREKAKRMGFEYVEPVVESADHAEWLYGTRKPD